MCTCFVCKTLLVQFEINIKLCFLLLSNLHLWALIIRDLAFKRHIFSSLTFFSLNLGYISQNATVQLPKCEFFSKFSGWQRGGICTQEMVVTFLYTLQWRQRFYEKVQIKQRPEDFVTLVSGHLATFGGCLV